MRIGIYGPFGWGNMGDAAIQEAMLANVRARCPRAKFLGISLNPTNTEAIHGIEAVPIHRHWSPPPPATSSKATSPSESTAAETPRRHPLVARLRALARPLRPIVDEIRFCARSVKILRELDLLVISGGGQISDDWGGPMDHPWSMFAWSLCARLAGTPVVVVSVGVGPIDHPWSRRLFFGALRLASYRSVRDVESRDFLRQAGCTLPVEVYPDLAFSHPLPDGRRDARDGAVVGLSPMSYCHPKPGLWPEQDEGRYRHLMAALEGFGESALADGHPVHLFSNQIRNDLAAFEDVQQRLPKATAEPTRDLAHLLRQIAGVDVVVTSAARRHPLVSAGSPGHRAVLSVEDRCRRAAVRSGSIPPGHRPRHRAGASPTISRAHDGARSDRRPHPVRRGESSQPAGRAVRPAVRSEEACGVSTVTVVTPVYNGEAYLAECIESVLAQTYSDWTYFIVNNCSTDRSRAIAQSYADRDPRVRIVDNEEFLSQVDNLNRAMALTEPDARYTKMVFADDTLFPRCLAEMVRVGDTYPTAGIIGAWRKDDEIINCNGLPGPDELFDGKDVGRRCLVDDVFVAGSPNTLMYRADLVRARDPFYPLGTFHEDTELFFELLIDHDFGYVHEVLTFTRRENESLSSTIWLHDYEHRLDKLVVTMKYGPAFLDADEFGRHRDEALEAYYRFLAGRTQFRIAEGFWAHHHRGLTRAGLKLDRGRFLRAWISTFLRSLFDGSLARRLSRRLTLASLT